MRLKDLFDAIDRKPFKAFVIELLNGRKVKVSHPENIFVFPNRETAYCIHVFDPGGRESAMFWPDGINALLFNGKKARPK